MVAWHVLKAVILFTVTLHPCLHNFSEFEIYFLEFPRDIVLDVISGNYLYL